MRALRLWVPLLALAAATPAVAQQADLGGPGTVVPGTAPLERPRTTPALSWKRPMPRTPPSAEPEAGHLPGLPDDRRRGPQPCGRARRDDRGPPRHRRHPQGGRDQRHALPRPGRQAIAVEPGALVLRPGGDRFTAVLDMGTDAISDAEPFKPPPRRSPRAERRRGAFQRPRVRMHGSYGAAALADPIRLHGLVPHHLPRLHGRAGGVARLPPGPGDGLGPPLYDRLFDFWLKIFAVAFGLGVVSGIVMAFQFGTNWSELARRTGPIQGPLLGYESFTAFALEASFFGVLMFGRARVPRWFYLFACLMVCFGTSLSSFWILVNNSWMQHPVGFTMRPDGLFVPTDWFEILFNSVVWVRFPHMLLAAYVTTSFCVAATGAWYMLRGTDLPEARRWSAWGLARRDPGAVATVLPPSDGRLRRPAPALEDRRHRGPLGEPGPGRGDPVRLARRGPRDESVRRRPAAPGGQPDRRWDAHGQGHRPQGHSEGRPAAGPDPVLRLPHHGRLRPADAGAGLGRPRLLRGRSARTGPLAAMGHLPLLSPRLRATLTGWFTAEVGASPGPFTDSCEPPTPRRRSSRRPRCDLARGVRGGVRADLRRRHGLHLPPPQGRAPADARPRRARGQPQAAARPAGSGSGNLRCRLDAGE